MNNCSFVGRLTAIPEIRYFTSGTVLCTFSLAVDDNYRKRRAEAEGLAYAPDFLDFKVWGQSGENLAKYAVKGQQLIVQASAVQDKWTDDNGNHSRTVFKVNQWEFGSKPMDAATRSQAQDNSGGKTISKEEYMRRKEAGEFNQSNSSSSNSTSNIPAAYPPIVDSAYPPIVDSAYPPIVDSAYPPVVDVTTENKANAKAKAKAKAKTKNDLEATLKHLQEQEDAAFIDMGGLGDAPFGDSVIDDVDLDNIPFD